MNSTESCNYRLGKILKTLQASFYNKTDLCFEIPKDPQKFYEDVGLLFHPKTGKIVPKLASYQYDIWKDSFHYPYRLTIKSQKCGITTSSLYEDFQKAITTCRGKEILIIAQSLLQAKDHLSTLRGIIKSSCKYRHFLIDRPDKLLSRDEITKSTVLFIRNPQDSSRPTKIMARGANESSIWSWKNVAHIHMSDVAATNQIDDSGLFYAAFSRLANTNGTIHIETPPMGRRGKVWEIYRNSELGQGSEEFEAAKFRVRKVYASMAVDAGLIIQEFLNEQREKMGLLYGQYYECDFLNPYTSWYTEDMFKYSDELAEYMES
jgi:hypothetical protein